MAVVEISRIQVRRGQENQTGVPVLESGEFGWASDTENLYIGLRRVDGGARDANVRILTENDLRNFFSSEVYPSFANTGSNYTFRVDTYIATTSTAVGPYLGGTWTSADLVIRSVQNKLDDFVNVKDFGAVGDGINDDFDPIQRAIDHLFLRDIKDENEVISPKSTSTEKVLYIPAGQYRISEYINLPRKTKIQGEGKENTVLIQINSGSGFFKTVGLDSIPGSYIEFVDPNTNNISSPNEPYYVSIENLTLHDSTGWPVGNPMIQLDVSSHSCIRDVRMRGSFDKNLVNIVNSTYAGITMRGYASNEYNSKNIIIENCQFEDLGAGIICNYDVDYVTIDKCYFNNLDRGIVLNDPIDAMSNNGPRYFKILNSSFDEIQREGIYSGSNLSNTVTNHLSYNNVFGDVGNYFYGFATSTGTTIINFTSDGNVSRNDYFARYQNKLEESQLTSTLLFPLITGGAMIEHDGQKNFQIGQNSTSSVMLFPLISQPQVVKVQYQLNDGVVDRQGDQIINIKQGVSPSIEITETFNYNEKEGPEFVKVVNYANNSLKFTVYNPPGAGSGATFSITNDPWPTYSGSLTTGTYTNLLITAGGVGFASGETLTISGGGLGGSSPINDLKILITSINTITGAVLGASISSSVAASVTTSTTYSGLNSYTTNKTISNGLLKLQYSTSIQLQRV